MTPVIEENQLNKEIQELYLISKKWISDLEFFERNLSFLQKLVDRGCSQLKEYEGNASIAEMKLTVTNLQNCSEKLKKNVTSYLSVLEQLVKDSSQDYGVGLIETHSYLEYEISSLLKTFKPVKQRVFKLTSERIKAVNAQNYNNLY